METTLVTVAKKSDFTKKANIATPQIGKWYKFSRNNETVGYGKVLTIKEDGILEVEKYFEMPAYRPYASSKWYDSLPFAVNEI